MNEPALITIVIPTFNRAGLISETLRSIQEQTFSGWECLIIDDGSTDNTEEIVSQFKHEDERFQYLKRPKTTRKGGNVCRNLGLDLAKGAYIQFFDSDDLMLPDKLEAQINYLQTQQLDYVITKTKNFQHPNPDVITNLNDSYYRFETFPISHANYVSQRINWLTPDFFGKRSLIGDIRFNQKLPSGQEYNFYCKLTTRSVKASVLDKYTTLRRMHPGSLRSRLETESKRLYRERMILKRETYLELEYTTTKDAKRILFNSWLLSTLDVRMSLTDSLRICWKLLLRGQFATFFWYKMYKIFHITLNRGHYFRKKIQSTLDVHSNESSLV